MPSARLCNLLLSATVWGFLVGCAARIPPQLAQQVAWNVDFPAIRQQPEAYRGRVVALGGIVTQIEAADEGYRVIVSDLPLDGSSRYRPAVGQLPRGRFMVLIPGHAFPTGLRPSAEVTVVGEVLAKGTLSGAGVSEEVPLLNERYIKVWGPSWWPRIQLGIWGGIGL
jgi:outer membrane lipoprotein